MRLTLYFIIGLILLSGCRKEPSGPPFIDYDAPAKNQVYELGDDILIQGSARDEEQLHYFKLTLLNEQGQTVETLVDKSLSQKQYSFSHRRTFDGTSLLPGRYTLSAKLEGTGGNATYNRYLQLGKEATGTGTVIAALHSTFQLSKHRTYVNLINLMGDTLGSLNFPGEYVGSAVLNHYLFVSVYETPNHKIMRVDLKTQNYEEIWSSNTMGTIRSHITGSKKIYVSFDLQTILGFDHTGQIFTVNMNKVPLFLTENRDKLFVYGRSTFGSQPEMQVFHSSTSGQLSAFQGQSNTLEGICSFTNEPDKAYYVSNSGNGASIYRVNDVLNNTSELTNRFSQRIRALNQEAIVVNNRALFASETGAVYGLSSSEIITEVFPIASFSDVRALRYDGSSTVGVVDGNRLLLYDDESYTSTMSLNLSGQNGDAQLVVLP